MNQELASARRLSEQQILLNNTKTQETLTKLTLELDRTRRRLSDYERFIHVRRKSESLTVDSIRFFRVFFMN